MPRAARTLLYGGGLVLVLLAGAAAVAAAAVTGVRTMILTATAHGAGQVLDQELRLVSPSWSARTAEEMRQERERCIRQVLDQLDRIEAALPDALEAHKGSDENDYDDRYLAGYADGLAGRTLGEGNVVPISHNGQRPAG